MFYETKAKVQSEDGKITAIHSLIKNVNLHGEAELKTMEELGDCDVFAVFRSKIVEIVNQDGEDLADNSYIGSIEITYPPISEKSKPKKMSYKVIVFANSIDLAKNRLNEYLQQGLDDMELTGIKQSDITQVL